MQKQIELNKDLEVQAHTPTPLKKGGKISLQGKHFILTIPNLNVRYDLDGGKTAKARVRKALEEMFGKPGRRTYLPPGAKVAVPVKLEKYLIAFEHHATVGEEVGKPHIHVVLSFVPNPNSQRGTWHITSKKELDYIVESVKPGSTGNYQTCRNFAQCINYLQKEDQNVLTNFSPEELLAFKKAKTTKQAVGFELVAIEILKGTLRNETDVVEKYPGFMLQHSDKICKFFGHKTKYDLNRQVLPWYGLAPLDLGKPDGHYKIRTWVNTNIRRMRPLKTPNLYIYGKTNMGKTTLWQEVLAKSLRIYVWNTLEKFQCGYTDDYDLIVVDEFDSNIPITLFNQWLDGQRLQIPQKGKGAYEKRKNTPVLVLSNIPLHNQYLELENGKRDLKEAFEGRFEYVELTEFLELALAPPPPQMVPPTPPLDREETEVIDLADKEDVSEDLDVEEVNPTQHKTKKGKSLKNVLVFDDEDEFEVKPGSLDNRSEELIQELESAEDDGDILEVEDPEVESAEDEDEQSIIKALTKEERNTLLKRLMREKNPAKSTNRSNTKGNSKVPPKKRKLAESSEEEN